MMCNSLVLTQLLLCNLVFLCFSFVGTVMLRHHSWYSLEDGCREQCSRKSHSPNYIMNPKGVPTKGMWIKVFVKALPKILLFTEKCPFLNDNSPLCCRFML